MTKYRGRRNADLVICQATLEHVTDNTLSVTAIASALKPGGVICLFVPCRNALYARLNLVLPERLKNLLLEMVQPGLTEHQGFPARYDHCTPSQMKALFDSSGIDVIETKLFWKSSYFANFVPAWLVWRLWQGALRIVKGNDAAETFIITGRRRDD